MVVDSITAISKLYNIFLVKRTFTWTRMWNFEMSGFDWVSEFDTQKKTVCVYLSFQRLSGIYASKGMFWPISIIFYLINLNAWIDLIKTRI